MKLLLENWRAYIKEVNAELIFEDCLTPENNKLLKEASAAYENKTLNEQQLLKLFETRVDNHMSELLNEGMIDIIKSGYGKAKELVGAAKEKYDAAVAKLGEYYLRLGIELYSLLEKAKGGFRAIAAAAHSAAKKVKQFCDAHPVLCTMAKLLIIMCVCACLVGAAGAAAKTSLRVDSIDGEGGFQLDPWMVDHVKGCLEVIGDPERTSGSGVLPRGWRGDPTYELGGEAQQLAVRAFNFVTEAATSETIVDLESANQGIVDVVRGCLENMTDTYHAAKDAGHGSQEDQIFWQFVRAGRRTNVWVQTNLDTLRNIDYLSTKRPPGPGAPTIKL